MSKKKRAGRAVGETAFDAAGHTLWQRERQAFYRRWHQRQLDALATPDDDRVRFMRTPHMADDQGTGRAGRPLQVINPALAAHLDRVLAGADPLTRPSPPVNEKIANYLYPATLDRWALAAARLAYAEEDPDTSLILELTGWQMVSQSDLAHAFNDGARSGWSQPHISARTLAACRRVRELVIEIRGAAPTPATAAPEATVAAR